MWARLLCGWAGAVTLSNYADFASFKTSHSRPSFSPFFPPSFLPSFPQTTPLIESLRQRLKMHFDYHGVFLQSMDKTKRVDFADHRYDA